MAAASSAHASEPGCYEDIAQTTASLARSHGAALSQCVKRQSYPCPTTGLHITASENALRNKITSPSGDCAAALTGGTPLSNLGPATCPSAFQGCETTVPAITDLDTLADCLICIEAALARELRRRLDPPRQTASHVNEQKCISTTTRTLIKTLRNGRKSVDRCAKGATKPFACAADDDPLERFGNTLSKVDRKLAKCRDAAGTLGELSGKSALLCDRAGVDAAGLSECVQNAARCLVCSHANMIYDQTQDCAEFSESNCRGVPARSGLVYAANRESDSVTIFEPGGTPINGTLASSSFAVGDAPIDIAVNEELNTIYVANEDDDTISMLDGITGEPALGTIASSTVALTSRPKAVAVDALTNMVFVVLEDADAVVILNASTGAYMFGSEAASTLAVGDMPSDVALFSNEDVLFGANHVGAVTNFADDTVTLLDTDAGDYEIGNLASSTFPTGDGPTSIAADADTLFIVNRLAETVSYLILHTGMPRFGSSVAESSLSTGPSPSDVVLAGDVIYVSNDGDSSVTVFDAGLNVYHYVTLASSTFPVESPVSAMAYGAGTPYLARQSDDEIDEVDPSLESAPSHIFIAVDDCSPTVPIAVNETAGHVYVLCTKPFAFDDSRVYVLDALQPAYAFGTHAASTFLLNDRYLKIQLNEPDGVAYLIGNVLIDNPPPPGASIAGVAFYDVDTWTEVPGSPHATFSNPLATAFNSTDDILYVTTPTRLLYLDASTGEPLTGDYATSHLTTTAGFLPSTPAVNESAGLVYLSSYDGVIYVDADTPAFAFGSEAASLFPGNLSDQAVAVEVSTNRVVSAGATSPSGYAVMYDASNGSYANGTLAASTFPVLGLSTVVDTVRVFADESADLVYAAGLDGATMLDAANDDYLYGGAANLSFIKSPVVAVAPALDRLYALFQSSSHGGKVGSLGYLRASTGVPINAAFPRSTFAAGDGPAALAVMP